MTTAADMVALYIDAEAKVLKGLTVRFGDRMLTRVNLPEIRAGRHEWEARAAAETAAAAGRRGGGFKIADFRSCE